jgi:hypothetical protein
VLVTLRGHRSPSIGHASRIASPGAITPGHSARRCLSLWRSSPASRPNMIRPMPLRKARHEEIGPLLLVCSSGGHLMQMLELRPAWDAFSRVWVTFDKSDARSLLRGERVVYAHGPTNRNLRNLVRNLALAYRVLRVSRPSALVTTGAGVAVPFAWIARLRRIPVLYIESFTRIEELSMSGRMIRPIAERLYVQWPDTGKTGGRYAGTVFAEQ